MIGGPHPTASRPGGRCRGPEQQGIIRQVLQDTRFDGVLVHALSVAGLGIAEPFALFGIHLRP